MGGLSGPDRLPGGQTITTDTPINKIPLLVRAGSIVPMAHSSDTPPKTGLIPLSRDLFRRERKLHAV